MAEFTTQDGTRVVPTIQYPLGSRAAGSYAKGMLSGTIGAGLAAASPVFSFRWGSAAAPVNLAIVKQVQITLGDLVGFTAGFMHFDMFAARSFSASDSGGTAGTLTNNNAKLRTSFPTSLLTDFRVPTTGTLTAGTRTLDTDPLATLGLSVVATAGSEPLSQFPLFNVEPGECPLILANNEGFVIQATVPATGTWQLGVSVLWDEVESY